MHIYLWADVGPRIIACEEAHLRFGFRSARTGAPARGAARRASVDLFGGDGESCSAGPGPSLHSSEEGQAARQVN